MVMYVCMYKNLISMVIYVCTGMASILLDVTFDYFLPKFIQLL